MRTASLLFLLICFSCACSNAQDTLFLNNGKKLPVAITDDSGARVFFEATNKRGGMKEYEVHKSEIFSIKKMGEEETILYVQDPVLGYDLSTADMRFYMAGQNDAREGFRTLPTAIGGFVLGAGSVFYMEGGYVPFMTPILYSITMQIPYIKIKESTITEPKYMVSDYYVEGYNKTARSKKFIHSFLATFAGVAVGSLVYELTQ